jgi:formyltetrahydrofolate deformylase
MAHANEPAHRGRLLISCADRPGIIAAVSQFLYSRGANIVHSDQHSTAPIGGGFFLRIEFELHDLLDQGPSLGHDFAPLAAAMGMEWEMTYVAHRKRLAIFVSRHDHCLLELLWQWRAGDLPVDIACIVSNHRSAEETANTWNLPFHHVPVSPETKDDAEAREEAIIAGAGVDLIVLARYMQVLSGGFVSRHPHRIINIHHSFLPAFAGAKPYEAAHERGVKLIGATAHYVTEDLDAGPIIEQDVQRVDHRHTPDDLRRLGRQIERVVLARAVRWHVEDRILVHGNSTVVFA